MAITLTANQIHQISPYTPVVKAQTYVDGINQAMSQFGITEWADVCMFIAQILEESGGLNYTTELASGQEYEGRKDLGNTSPGDGVKYKGRGLIQCTGKDEYTQLSQALGQDFVNNPTLLATSPYCCLSAGWFWKWKNISPLTVPDNEAAFEAVTRKVNGGLNGLSVRQQYWYAARQYIPQPAPSTAIPVAPHAPVSVPVQNPTPQAPATTTQVQNPTPSSWYSGLTSWFH